MTIDAAALGLDTRLTLLASGLVFLWALALGVWKYHGIMTSPGHHAHIYVDIAHRAALLYSFAIALAAVFVELSAWPQWVDLTAAAILVFFFVAAIASYCWHGARRDTENQLAPPGPGVRGFMVALIVAEIGAFTVLLTGFVAAW
ncbi:hypothetical protein [Tsukamurella ocularis]|uniref:hypothetical protein n=1 Tax=Tsukamurella ocularis TaxID=1970234 RepID=UPI002169DE93|nr:hypothetical protein [Tsukamurella ocularis]MCS3779016.1 hypothetical protein [Tsukamurella ocularis]MCS3787364.1 hypothetical protein [Tsukamurella ocularis]MCS3851699.1 hypothetical protein [Tsukamurella ocularis]